MTKKLFLLSGVIAALALASAPASAADIVGLITKTNTNPFFVKMKQGFEAKAKELGLTPQAYAGKYDGDNDSQVAAIETLVNAGAKGILLVPSDSTAMVPTVEKARKAGVLVITLDTPLDPVTAADANFATDNFKAGLLIGQWAKATLGDKASKAKIATLDLTPNQPTVDYLRHNGFLTGFGIPVKDPKHYSQSDSPQIVGSDITHGDEPGGRKAMENILHPYSYLMTRRIERAMALLRRGDLSVTEVCFEVGCSSLGTFSTRFTELVGMPPGAYRRRAARATEGMPPCVAKSE